MQSDEETGSAEEQPVSNMAAPIPITERCQEPSILAAPFSIRQASPLRKAMKKKDIKDGKIEIVTIKTTSRIVVELNNMAVSILVKYYNLPGSAILPQITDQRLTLNSKLFSIFFGKLKTIG